VLSQEKPDFTKFIAQFGFEGNHGETRGYQRILDSLKNGAKYRFRLCANPVYSLKGEAGKRGKVVPHVTVRQQEAWLKEKCVKLGFSLDESVIVQRELKKFTRQGKYVTLHIAVFEGILTVCQADVFKETLVQGIGRAKSYGCGLLTLARL
jgi:CRISPR system Cascade subunit CasE